MTEEKVLVDFSGQLKGPLEKKMNPLKIDEWMAEYNVSTDGLNLVKGIHFPYIPFYRRVPGPARIVQYKIFKTPDPDGNPDPNSSWMFQWADEEPMTFARAMDNISVEEGSVVPPNMLAEQVPEASSGGRRRRRCRKTRKTRKGRKSRRCRTKRRRSRR